MKVFCVAAVQTRGRVDVLHDLLYHGKSEMADFNSTGTYSHYIGGDLSSPLLLTRSGSMVPPLFKPGNSIVVTEKVYDEINSKMSVAGVAAKPKKLINCWFPAGDTSYLTSKKFPYLRQRPDKVLEKTPNDPFLFDDFPNCLELVAFNTATDPTPEKDFEFNFKLKRNDLISVKRKVSKTNLEKYPLTWCAVPLMRYDLFEIVEKYIDPDYFEVIAMEI